ncbi:hypothetical protein [Paraburkholderia domus]|uniref:hypothetical protein n=1 Tax=Paraburkholderia domus TaxID=2793075 RepID=UPI00191278B5|nr:hypothetical protein [Paraburkholderia domus]MBK5049875.1 hypothetical protein [Burkholderia sp. R-70006]MBK5062911.1 hypothetical protein [Burkholderia sp. R-70199]CAE6747737.1 hypothetical protein R70006_02890 [Paraburkholderia domus]CAE6910545.1 hypothetical protein R70199_04281 [Paraburkholderia domus]
MTRTSVDVEPVAHCHNTDIRGAVSNVPVAGKTGGGTQYALDAVNGPNDTRWDVRGAEDRGGGLVAIFT